MFGFFEEVPLIPRVELPQGNFNYQSANHLDFINKCTLRFQQAQKILHRIDTNIIRGVAVGSTSWVGCYVFPLVTVSIAAFCFATYYYAYHEEAFAQYQEALNDLIAAYQWSMGKETDNHWYKFGVIQLQELVLTLGPCATTETICTWQSSDLEPASMLSPYSRENEPSTAFKAKLTQFAAGDQTKEWQFLIYGEGGTDDLWGAIQNKGRNLVGSTVSTMMRT